MARTKADCNRFIGRGRPRHQCQCAVERRALHSSWTSALIGSLETTGRYGPAYGQATALRIVSADTLVQSTAIDASNRIKAAEFGAFLRCPTKAHLLAISEPPPDTFFADIELRISSMHKAAVNPARRPVHDGERTVATVRNAPTAR